MFNDVLKSLMSPQPVKIFRYELHTVRVVETISNRMKVMISQKMFREVQPIIVISRMVGLMPVKYEKNGDKYELSLSYLYWTYSYLFGFILASSALLGLVGDLKATPENSLRIKDTKGAYVVSCDLGFMIFIVILGIFISPFKIDKFFPILDAINQVRSKLPVPGEKDKRKTSFMICFSSYFLFLSVLTYDFIGWCIQTSGKPSASRLWNNIPVYLLYVVSWTQEIFFWHMTYFVQRGMMAFNKGLSLHKEDDEEKGKFLVSKNDKQNIFSVDNMGRLSVSKYLKRNVMPPDKAESFIQVHRILFEAINLINDWYGIPLLLILLSCFLQLIGTPYFMLSNTGEKSLVFAVLEVVWLFTHTSRLLIIVEASDRCIREYNKSNFLLCQHLDSNYEYGTMQKLKVLASQVKTCKANISTCGVANVNRSILASIAGAVSTFLVILVQLDENSIPTYTEEPTTERLQ